LRRGAKAIADKRLPVCDRAVPGNSFGDRPIVPLGAPRTIGLIQIRSRGLGSCEDPVTGRG
jgi:hypothetical protein